MPIPSDDLSRLDPNSFEHMVNFIALRVLGSGATGFGPGPDGGRDGYFEGKALYPSTSTNWEGKWYIQSKFLRNHIGSNPHQWLLAQIKAEIAEFTKPQSKRRWPDIWIIATNVEPSGVPQTGSFDQARNLVEAARPQLAERFDIWGGRKILDFLASYPEISNHYAEFLTPGEIIAQLYESLIDLRAQPRDIIRYLVASQLTEQQYTRLEQAGSATDGRPGIHRLFTDIPYRAATTGATGMAAADLAKAVAENHRPSSAITESYWKHWSLEPRRARVWFVKGGPGQGKSTLSQYISQIQRAALTLGTVDLNVSPRQRSIAEEIKTRALADNIWPTSPRIPLTIELKEYAQWCGGQNDASSRRLLTYMAFYLSKCLGDDVVAGSLKRAFSRGRWMFIFDGLDEVPGDVKEQVSSEVDFFINDQLIGIATDALAVCTSRPQGYSGQWDGLDAATIDLIPLSPDQALACAGPVLRTDRAEEEAAKHIAILTEAISSPAVRELMTTPLQSHIMAVVVRDGGRPPERRWQLFVNFYDTIRKREANKNLTDRRLAALLREEEQLIKYLHNRVGFELHSRAETSDGAVTSMRRDELLVVVREIVKQLKDHGIDDTVALVMEATTERLVLVNTPDEGNEVRFDIRQLQEFFAAEYIYEADHENRLADRMLCIGTDSHWREVVHFLLSALIESNRMVELRNAVSVIEQMDDGNGEQIIRPLGRRLALGGVLTSRLLQEGVLEQDKRLRGIFRPCLLPLLGCPSAIEYLGHVSSPQSRAWLSDVVCDAISELSEEESVGAMALSTFLLEDANPRVEFVQQRYDESSDSFRGAVIRAIGRGGRFEEEWIEPAYRYDELRPWFCRSLIRLLIRGNWGALGTESLSVALRALRFGKWNVRSAAEQVGLSSEVCLVLASEFDKPHEDGRSTPHFQEEHREEAGGYRIFYLGPADIAVLERWGSRSIRDTFAGLGYFAFVSAVANFIRTGAKEDYEIMLNSIERDLECFYLLPPNLAFYLSDFVCGRNREPSDCGFELARQKERPGMLRHVMVTPETEKAGLDCPRLAIQFPLLVFDAAIGEFGGAAAAKEQIREFLCSDEGAGWGDSVLKLGQIDPFLFVGDWGDLFGLQRFGDVLRAFVRERASAHAVQHSATPMRVAFRLALPDEAPLLPHVVNSMVAAVERRIGHDNPGRNVSKGTRFRALVDEFVSDPGDLERCHRNQSLSKSERAGALVLDIVCTLSVPGRDIGLFQPMLEELYDSDNGHWFPLAIATSLYDAVLEGNKQAIVLVGAVIELTRCDYKARIELDAVFESWREMARAPVQKSSPSLWR